MIEFLVQERKIDINQPNIIGMTPLMTSVLFGHYGATKKLLDLSANPNITNDNLFIIERGKVSHLCKIKNDALTIAAIYNDIKLTNILLNHGAKTENLNNISINIAAGLCYRNTTELLLMNTHNIVGNNSGIVDYVIITLRDKILNSAIVDDRLTSKIVTHHNNTLSMNNLLWINDPIHNNFDSLESLIDNFQ